MNSERLIVFVKAPRPGLVKTRLARSLGPQAACAAYLRLVEMLLSGFRLLDQVELCFTPDDAASEIQAWMRKPWSAAPQGQGDLGRRLVSAFERAFTDGMKRVAIIGADCPAVTVPDIHESFAALRDHDVVVGPAMDGGYWLVGMNGMHSRLFDDISWGTERVFSETMNHIRNAGLTVQVLRELEDVDTEEEWRRFVANENNRTA